MTPRSNTRRTPEPFTANEQAMLDALKANRDEGGEGLHEWELKGIGGLIFIHSFAAKLRAHRYVIGKASDGRYALGHDESGVERCTHAAPAPLPSSGPDGPVGASLSAEQGELFESTPSAYERDAA